MRTVLLLGAFLLTGATVSVAQRSPLRAGERVRVARQSPSCPVATCQGPEVEIVGSLVSLGADTVLLLTGSGTQVVRRDLVARIDTSRGRKRRTGKGAVVGLLAGGLGGAIFGFLVGQSCNGWFFCITPAQGAVTGGLTFGAGGLVAGAIVGSFVREDRWETVLRYRPGASLVPGSRGYPRAGVAVSARITF